MASISIPNAMKNTPIEIDLKPAASIPVPNFFITFAIITPAAIAAKAEIKDPACVAIIANFPKSINLHSLSALEYLSVADLLDILQGMVPWFF